MKTIHITMSVLAAACLLFTGSLSAHAESKEIVDKFVVTSEIKGCETDRRQHCKDVTPGENREILCLMAHEDQLLDSCKIGIIESAVATQAGIAALDYAYEACGKDRADLCGNVAAGEGRLLKCIRDNQSKVSGQCVTALKDTGFWAAIEPASGN